MPPLGCWLSASPRPAQVSPMKRNTAWTLNARRSEQFYFITKDAAPDCALNEIIWKAVRGENTLMPAPRRGAFRRLEPQRKKNGDD